MHRSTLLLCCLAGCAIPARDNPRDPANLAEPSFSVSVDGANSATGSRGSAWVLDGADTTGAGSSACFEWALSQQAVDDPTEASTTWDDLDAGQPAECQRTLSSAENDLFVTSLRSITDFRRATAIDDPCDDSDELIGEETLDGTGVATRWARLRVRTGRGTAETFRLLTVVNDPPQVSLGADRRTAPGGRWWLSAGQAFSQRIEATVTDPDGPPFDLSWTVTGALANVIDLDDDGEVDVSFVDGAALNLPMPLDPSRTMLTLTATDLTDPDGVVTARAGCDSVRADVLTTVWAYSAGTGHLRRLDTSQFLNPFNETDQGVFASDGSRMLIVEEVGASVRPYVMKRGFSPEASAPLTTPNFDLTSMAAAWDGSGGWWVQNGENGSLRHYDENLDIDRTFTTIALEGDVGDFDFTAFQAGVVRGPGTDAWVIGGDRVGNSFNTTGQRLFRVKTDGTVVVRRPAHTDAGAVSTRIVPDGEGGVWVSADGSPRVHHVDSAGVTALPVFDLTGTSCDGGVAELAFDDTRDVLWLGVYGTDSPLLCRVTPDDPGGAVPQRVDTLGTIVVDASDGTALMIANDGDGISRYHQDTVESIDYIPMNPQFRAKKMVAAGGNLAVWLENKTVIGQNRMAVVEGGEIFVPNNLPLEVDPYLFDEVAHATDPVTGFAWVWHPDDSKIAAYAYGERIYEQSVPGIEEKRVRIALDPVARRLYLAWSTLYTGNGVDPPAVGRLLYMDLASDLSPMVVSTAADIEISILRGIGVVPSLAANAPGRICLAANLEGEGRGLAYLHPLDPGAFTDVVQPVATLNPGDNTPVHVAVDPVLGHCLFVPNDGSDFMRMNADATPDSSGAAAGMQLSRPSVASDGRAWSADANGDALWFIDPTTQLQFSSPTLESPIAGDALSVVADPYYDHVFAGYALGGVTRLVVPPAGVPIESSRELGTDRPSLDHGR